MMMIPDKRKVATMILSKMDGGGLKNDVEVKPETDLRQEDGPLDIIAQDLLQAFQEKSVMGIKDGLRAFFEEYSASESKE